MDYKCSLSYLFSRSLTELFLTFSSFFTLFCCSRWDSMKVMQFVYPYIFYEFSILFWEEVASLLYEDSPKSRLRELNFFTIPFMTSSKIASFGHLKSVFNEKASTGCGRVSGKSRLFSSTLSNSRRFSLFYSLSSRVKAFFIILNASSNLFSYKFSTAFMKIAYLLLKQYRIASSTCKWPRSFLAISVQTLDKHLQSWKKAY